MPHVTDDAICIRHWDFSETSQTVSLFGRASGLVRGLAKGSKRVGGRFSGGIDLLTLGQFVAIVKPGRELATLTDWTLARTWRSLRSDLLANQSAYYLVDLVQRMMAPHDPHPATFGDLVEALEQIDSGHAAGATLLFQWRLLDELGYRPVLDGASAASGATLLFSPGAGGIVTRDEPGAWKVRRQTVDLLSQVAAGERSASALKHLVEGDGESTARANRLLAAYVRHLLGTHPTTMRQLFPEL